MIMIMMTMTVIPVKLQYHLFEIYLITDFDLGKIYNNN